MEITKEEFQKIYELSNKVCAIKCSNNHTRMQIKFRRQYKDESYPITRHDYMGDCYECRCSPDMDFMFAELNRLLKKKEAKR